MKGSSNVFRLKIRLHGQDVKDIALERDREYSFGRGSDCDIQLEDQPGISRAHFKLSDDGTTWSAQVISKFGDINFGGASVQSVKLEVGTVFKVSGYDFIFYEPASGIAKSIPGEAASDVSNSEMAMAVGQSEARSPVAQTGNHSGNLPAPVYAVPFDGSDEATKVMEIAATGDPYVRIIEPSGHEETVKLEGRKWTAGRDEGSQILLNDRKASRRQFELVVSPQGNFIRDLGSSNGTQLNGMPLAPDELKPMRSGDVIQVGALQIHFEVRDPHFERRLQIVPKEVLQAQLPAPQHVTYEMINYPVAQGPGGAVRLNAAGVPAHYESSSWDEADQSKISKTKKIRFALICAIILLPLIYFLTDMGHSNVPAKKELVSSPQMQAFQKLNPAKQQFVKEAYILGHNLYIQGKSAMAAEQFAKIHGILPDGFEDSISLAKECEDQHQQEINRLEVERQMKEAAQNKVIVIENLAKCRPIAMRTFDESELRTCLAPTYEREPENPTIAEDMNMIHERVSLRDAKNASARARNAKIAKGRELFKKAEETEKRGDVEAASDAYRAHLASNMPDPDRLRAISMKKVGLIEGNKAASISTYLSSAETEFVNHDYKSAINDINKVKGLDPYNQRAAELNGRINREKDQKLREIYEESILNEGLGQIDQAKANWKKIMDMDHPDGVYYKRAKNKMHSLGGI